VYAEAGRLEEAVASFVSDMGKHSETAEHPALGILVMKNFMGHFTTKEEVIKFIQEFN